MFPPSMVVVKAVKSTKRPKSSTSLAFLNLCSSLMDAENGAGTVGRRIVPANGDGATPSGEADETDGGEDEGGWLGNHCEYARHGV